jgi:hypothetical protein
LASMAVAVFGAAKVALLRRDIADVPKPVRERQFIAELARNLCGFFVELRRSIQVSLVTAEAPERRKRRAQAFVVIRLPRGFNCQFREVHRSGVIPRAPGVAGLIDQASNVVRHEPTPAWRCLHQFSKV